MRRAGQQTAAGEMVRMSLNHSVRVEPVGDLGAVVLDFEAHRARRQQLRLEAAAPGAAMALARC